MTRSKLRSKWSFSQKELDEDIIWLLESLDDHQWLTAALLSWNISTLSEYLSTSLLHIANLKEDFFFLWQILRYFKRRFFHFCQQVTNILSSLPTNSNMVSYFSTKSSNSFLVPPSSGDWRILKFFTSYTKRRNTSSWPRHLLY